MTTPDTTITRDLADFITTGPSPLHVTAEIARRLEAGGFSAEPQAGGAGGAGGGGILSRAAARRGGRRGHEAVPGPGRYRDRLAPAAGSDGGHAGADPC